MSTFSVTEPSRLDVFLASSTTHSRAKIQRLITAGNASVNGVVIIVAKHALKEGDIVTFTEPELDPHFPLAEHTPFEIIFEDEALIVLNKPVGMTVHPTTFQDTGTLVQALLAIRPEIAQAIYDEENPISRLRPGIVHRLDKGTGGLMVVAKTKESLQALALQFQNHTVQKTYEALLYGTLANRQVVNAPIRRKGDGSKNTMGASHNPEEGRAALSYFTPLHSFSPLAAHPDESVTLVSVEIKTGRTHQIRVHSKFIGHPVLGDHLYSNKPATALSEKLGITSQWLYAVKLSFVHPSTGKPLEFTLTPPYPSFVPHFDNTEASR